MGGGGGTPASAKGGGTAGVDTNGSCTLSRSQFGPIDGCLWGSGGVLGGGRCGGPPRPLALRAARGEGSHSMRLACIR